MAELLQDIIESTRREQLFDGTRRVVVACSGGGDSMALLDLMVRIAPEAGIELAVAHLHHGWRGDEADEHRDLAAAAAATRDLPFFCRRADLAAAPGSREEVARDARLAFFAEVVGTWSADAVALGHTADDQLETVVLHLARGAAGRGLGGMRATTEVRGVRLLRPLLTVRRVDLRHYARERGLQWGEDSSNQDISLSRNRLRRRLLADLQQINPGAVNNVARAAALLREEEEWLDGLAAQSLEELTVEETHAGGVALDARGLALLPVPLRRRVVRAAIEETRGHCREISHEHVEWVVEGNGAVARDLPGVRVRREGGLIRFLPLVGRRLASPGEK